MSTRSATKSRASNTRRRIALAGCALGLGLIFVGFGAVTKSKESQSSADQIEAPAKPQKTVRAWNIALGNVVVLGQELGFEVKAAKESAGEPGKIQARIETQLQSLRELYRQESETDPTLMGGMMLQLTVAASGEVSQVTELASRIADTDFKKVVVAEVSKWSFRDIISETTIVNCPLLFVREGMDITTLLQWEKSLGPSADKPVIARNVNGIQDNKTAPNLRAANGSQSAASAAPKAAPVAGKPLATIYQTKYAATVREDPNFGSPSVGRLSVGTKLSLISKHGDWLEVRAEDGDLSGFIRREFVTPIEIARRQ